MENYLNPDFYPVLTDDMGWEIIRKTNKEFNIALNGLVVGKINFETPLFLFEHKVALKDWTEIAVSLK